ncbi:MAG: hypothetical protein QOJ29_314, partial [Thermoleophilaceae bacterium]|nr:hypothetical protein [Thermoleophilaceae bacterium]
MTRPQSSSAGVAEESVDVEGAAHEPALVATPLTSNGSPLVSDTNDLGVLRTYSGGLSDHRKVRER